MNVDRKWFCRCSGKPVELPFVELTEEEPVEPACGLCGATPSSDPKKTVFYRDKEEWDS